MLRNNRASHATRESGVGQGHRRRGLLLSPPAYAISKASARTPDLCELMTRSRIDTSCTVQKSFGFLWRQKGKHKHPPQLRSRRSAHFDLQPKLKMSFNLHQLRSWKTSKSQIVDDCDVVACSEQHGGSRDEEKSRPLILRCDR